MQNHYNSHGECNDMHKRSGAFEDNRVGQLNISRIAVGYDSG